MVRPYVVIVLLLAAVPAQFAVAAEPAAGERSAPAAPSADAAAFARLKDLAGTWVGRMNDPEKGPEIRLTYEVASGGRAVLEKIAPGTRGEMVTVYYLAGGQLRATHYCALGNQPAYRFRAASGGRMLFDFDGGTGFDAKTDSHVHEGWIEPAGTDRLQASWTHWQDGHSTGSMLWYLSRR